MRCVATAMMTCTRARWAPKCADCHTENDWKEARLDHEKIRFPLEGKHVDTKCVDCHKKGAAYKDTRLAPASAATRRTTTAARVTRACTPTFCAKQLGHSVEMFLRTYAKWIDGGQNALEMNRLEATPHSGFVPDLSQTTTLNA